MHLGESCEFKVARRVLGCATYPTFLMQYSELEQHSYLLGRYSQDFWPEGLNDSETPETTDATAGQRYQTGGDATSCFAGGVIPNRGSISCLQSFNVHVVAASTLTSFRKKVGVPATALEAPYFQAKSASM